MTPDQFEPPSVNTKYRCVRIRRYGYKVLKKFHETMAPLAEMGSDHDRMAVITKWLLAAAERKSNADVGEQLVTKAQTETYWSALNGFPPWVIDISFLHCRTASPYPPSAYEVKTHAERTWGRGGGQIRCAGLITQDVHTHKREWMA